MENNREQTYYEILRISPTATLEEIKRAYRQRCMEYHPDVNPGANNKSGHEIMCKINEAYGVLRDVESRKIYDEILKSRGCPYPSEESQKPNEQPEQTSDQSGRPAQTYSRGNIYEHYYSVDFDDDMQEDYITWMEEYIYKYMNLVVEYYQKYYTEDCVDLIERLRNLFENNITMEKASSKKTQQSKNI